MGKAFSNFNLWEDHKNGLYGGTLNEDSVQNSIELLSNKTNFRDSMSNMVTEWGYSCMHNLTGNGNKRSWLGAAACNYNHGASMKATRVAWGRLSSKEREDANNEADKIIDVYSKITFYED